MHSASGSICCCIPSCTKTARAFGKSNVNDLLFVQQHECYLHHLGVQRKLLAQYLTIDLKLGSMVFLTLGKPSGYIKTRGFRIGLVIDDLGSNHSALIPPQYAPIDDTSNQLTIDGDEESAFIRHIEL